MCRLMGRPYSLWNRRTNEPCLTIWNCGSEMMGFAGMSQLLRQSVHETLNLNEQLNELVWRKYPE
jgi:hypothetical protein